MAGSLAQGKPVVRALVVRALLSARPLPFSLPLAYTVRRPTCLRGEPTMTAPLPRCWPLLLVLVVLLLLENPASGSAKAPAPTSDGGDAWWSLRPLVEPTVPVVADAPPHPID